MPGTAAGIADRDAVSGRVLAACRLVRAGGVVDGLHGRGGGGHVTGISAQGGQRQEAGDQQRDQKDEEGVFKPGYVPGLSRAAARGGG